MCNLMHFLLQVNGFTYAVSFTFQMWSNLGTQNKLFLEVIKLKSRANFRKGSKPF